MRKIAIIPARGGSKRIPRKNIKEFLGKPIIGYSIQTAMESGLFDEVMVSTDDSDIERVAKQYGAGVPFLRSQENASDTAGTSAVIVEVLSSYRKQGVAFDFACCIYPTAPLIKRSALAQAFELLIEKDFTTVFPVVSFSYPIWRSLKVEDNKAQMFWPEYLNSRSQDLPVAWHDAGQFYWLNVDRFLDEPVLFGSNSGILKLDELEVQDIDNETDWKLAELKYRLIRE